MAAYATQRKWIERISAHLNKKSQSLNGAEIQA